MNEQLYRSLPTNVRERFSAISDEQFSGHPEVVAARQRVDEANAGHRSAAELSHQFRSRKIQLDDFSETIRAQRREMHENRVRVVADALMVSGLDVQIVSDDELRDQIERFDLILEAMPVATGELDAKITAQSRRVGDAASDCANAEEALAELLDELKLAEARRLAS